MSLIENLYYDLVKENDVTPNSLRELKFREFPYFSDYIAGN